MVIIKFRFRRGVHALFNLEIKKKRRLSIIPDFHYSKVVTSELKTLEWDILNPDLSTYLEIKFMRKTSHI